VLESGGGLCVQWVLSYPRERAVSPQPAAGTSGSLCLSEDLCRAGTDYDCTSPRLDERVRDWPRRRLHRFRLHRTQSKRWRLVQIMTCAAYSRRATNRSC